MACQRCQRFLLIFSFHFSFFYFLFFSLSPVCELSLPGRQVSQWVGNLLPLISYSLPPKEKRSTYINPNFDVSQQDLDIQYQSASIAPSSNSTAQTAQHVVIHMYSPSEHDLWTARAEWVVGKKDTKPPRYHLPFRSIQAYTNTK